MLVIAVVTLILLITALFHLSELNIATKIALFTLLVVGILTVYGTLRRYCDDFILGKFTMDEKGMTMYSWNKSLHIDWDECVEFGITSWTANGAYGNVHAYNYYVYCSKIYLQPETKQRLIVYENRKQYDKHLLFQYRKELFDEFLTYIPETWQKRLIEEESKLNMNWLERKYNR